MGTIYRNGQYYGGSSGGATAELDRHEIGYGNDESNIVGSGLFTKKNANIVEDLCEEQQSNSLEFIIDSTADGDMPAGTITITNGTLETDYDSEQYVKDYEGHGYIGPILYQVTSGQNYGIKFSFETFNKVLADKDYYLSFVGYEDYANLRFHKTVESVTESGVTVYNVTCTANTKDAFEGQIVFPPTTGQDLAIYNGNADQDGGKFFLKNKGILTIGGKNLTALDGNTRFTMHDSAEMDLTGGYNRPDAGPKVYLHGNCYILSDDGYYKNGETCLPYDKITYSFYMSYDSEEPQILSLEELIEIIQNESWDKFSSSYGNTYYYQNGKYHSGGSPIGFNGEVEYELKSYYIDWYWGEDENGSRIRISAVRYNVEKVVYAYPNSTVRSYNRRHMDIRRQYPILSLRDGCLANFEGNAEFSASSGRFHIQGGETIVGGGRMHIHADDEGNQPEVLIDGGTKIVFNAHGPALPNCSSATFEDVNGKTSTNKKMVTEMIVQGGRYHLGGSKYNTGATPEVIIDESIKLFLEGGILGNTGDYSYGPHNYNQKGAELHVKAMSVLSTDGYSILRMKDSAYLTMMSGSTMQMDGSSTLNLRDSSKIIMTASSPSGNSYSNGLCPVIRGDASGFIFANVGLWNKRWDETLLGNNNSDKLTKPFEDISEYNEYKKYEKYYLNKATTENEIARLRADTYHLVKKNNPLWKEELWRNLFEEYRYMTEYYYKRFVSSGQVEDPTLVFQKVYVVYKSDWSAWIYYSNGRYPYALLTEEEYQDCVEHWGSTYYKPSSYVSIYYALINDSPYYDIGLQYIENQPHQKSIFVSHRVTPEEYDNTMIDIWNEYGYISGIPYDTYRNITKKYNDESYGINYYRSMSMNNMEDFIKEITIRSLSSVYDLTLDTNKNITGYKLFPRTLEELNSFKEYDSPYFTITAGSRFLVTNNAPYSHTYIQYGGKKDLKMLAHGGFSHMSGDCHLEYHDGSRLIMRGVLEDKKPWDDGRASTGKIDEAYAKWQRGIANWDKNSPKVEFYEAPQFIMRGKWNTEEEDLGTCTITFKTYDLETIPTTVEEFTEQTMDDFVKAMDTIGKYYSSGGTVSVVEGENGLFAITVTNYNATDKPPYWKEHLEKQEGSPLVEIIEDSELRLYGSSSIKMDDEGITFGNTTGTASFTIEELNNLKNGSGGTGGDNPPYELPIASETELGGVKIGEGINMAEDGTISVEIPESSEPYELPAATNTTLGGVKVGKGLSINDNGVLSANAQELTPATEETLGGVKIGSGLKVDEDGTLNVIGSYDENTKTDYVEGNGINFSNTSEEYVLLDYAQSNGNQQIYTDIYFDSNTQIIEIKYMPTNVSQRGILYTIDTYISYGGGTYWITEGALAQCGIGEGSTCYWSPGSKVEINRTYEDTITYKINEYPISTFGGVAQYKTTSLRQGPLTIFGAKGTSTRNSYVKLMKMTLKSDEETIIAELIPVKRKSDNAIGLLDKINFKFYTVDGGTPLIAGPERNEILSKGKRSINVKYDPTTLAINENNELTVIEGNSDKNTEYIGKNGIEIYEQIKDTEIYDLLSNGSSSEYGWINAAYPNSTAPNTISWNKELLLTKHIPINTKEVKAISVKIVGTDGNVGSFGYSVHFYDSEDQHFNTLTSEPDAYDLGDGIHKFTRIDEFENTSYIGLGVRIYPSGTGGISLGSIRSIQLALYYSEEPVNYIELKHSDALEINESGELDLKIKIVPCTQEQYDALTEKDPNTLYLIGD